MVFQSSSLLEQLSLPPGFRFYPTDEELLVQYLCRKASGHHFPLQIIGDIDLYKFDPWDLPSKAIFGENEWYFFSPRERKYPNGTRPNRVAGSGYWKATGTDKIITFQGKRVGIKKSLVFYVGKAPKGSKTNWIMHEYRISESHKLITNSKLDDWVLCRVYKKSCSTVQKPSISSPLSPSSSQHEDSACWATQVGPVNLDLSRLGSGDFNWATLAMLTMPQGQFQYGQAQISCNTSTVDKGTIQNYNCAAQQVNDQFIAQNRRRVNDVGFIAQSLNPYETSYPTRSHGVCLFN